MRVSSTGCLAACAVLVISISFAQAAFAAEILIADAKSQPESLTMAPGGVLIVAENASGKISALTVNGEKAIVTVIEEGLDTPTGVEPVSDTIWIAERGAGKAVSAPMPK